MAITYIDAGDQGVTTVELGNLETLEHVDLSDNSLEATDVDETLIQRAAFGMTDGFLDLTGDSMGTRTSSSDASLEALVDDGAEVWVKQANSDTTILGTDSITKNVVSGADLVWACQFTASDDGYPNSLDFYASANANVKVAIYEDNAGSVGDLVARNNNGQPVEISTYERLEMPAYFLSNATVYWIAAISDTNDGITVGASGTGTARYVASTYAGFEWPADGSFITSVTTRLQGYRVRI